MSNKKPPNAKISVIIGIYNCSETLHDAFDSLINQTFKDWIAIVCDDGSTDNSFEIANDYRCRFPNKFILLKNEKNMGLAYTLNRCLRNVETEYIARMDGDDISLPNRFTEELDFLENNKKYAFVSSSVALFDDTGIYGKSIVSGEPEKNQFTRSTPFCHAASMIRSDIFQKVNGYSEEKKFFRVEDWHLWIKLYSEGFLGFNLSNILYIIRDDKNSVKKRRFKYRINESRVIKYAVKSLHLPKWQLLWMLRPILIGILPSRIYSMLHRYKRKIKNTDVAIYN